MLNIWVRLVESTVIRQYRRQFLSLVLIVLPRRLVWLNPAIGPNTVTGINTEIGMAKSKDEILI
jgi:hypothetical protein